MFDLSFQEMCLNKTRNQRWGRAGMLKGDASGNLTHSGSCSAVWWQRGLKRRRQYSLVPTWSVLNNAYRYLIMTPLIRSVRKAKNQQMVRSIVCVHNAREWILQPNAEHSLPTVHTSGVNRVCEHIWWLVNVLIWHLCLDGCCCWGVNWGAAVRLVCFDCGWGPIHTGRAHATQANGTCWCEWECPHCTQATSKDLCLNLCTRIQCGLGLKPPNLKNHPQEHCRSL